MTVCNELVRQPHVIKTDFRTPGATPSTISLKYDILSAAINNYTMKSDTLEVLEWLLINGKS